MDQQLLQYIVAQEHAGYTEAQIRQALLSDGRKQADIDDAFKQAKGASLDPTIHEYVQQYARQSMTPVQIFTTLTQQGYAGAKVRRAIIEVFGPGTLPSKSHTAVFVLIALLVAAGGLYFLGIDKVIPHQAVQQVNAQEFSLSDQIAQVIIIARTQGTDTAVKECQLRLRNDNRDTCILDVAILDHDGSPICDQIIDLRLRDTCLMNFIDQDRAGICGRVKLKENLDTCQTLESLQSA